MDQRIVIFAGAGASYGVSSQKYPMTKQFFDGLSDTVKNSSLAYNFLTSYVEQVGGKTSIDIEDVLWVLGDRLSALDGATKKGAVLQHLLAKNQIHSITKMNPQGPEVLAQLKDLHRQGTTLRNGIHDEVYRYYNVLPADEELNGTWVPLLKWVRSLAPSSVDIFTTNYDLVIESALEGVDGMKIQTGRRAAVEVKLDVSLWDRGKIVDGGLLTKLHGSVDWQSAGTDTDGRPIIRWGHLEKHGPHDIRGIIYPGFKGAPQSEPFKSFHQFFGDAAKRATHILFIGFAFRDFHINELLTASLPPSAKIAVIDPSPNLPSQLFLADATHVQMGFGPEAASPPGPVGYVPQWLTKLQEWLK